MGTSLVMINPDFTTADSAILRLMSEVLHPAQDYEPSDYECAALLRKTAALDELLTRVSAESTGLKNRCVLLAQEVTEVQKLGDGRLWVVGKETKPEYCFQMLSLLPRKLRLNTPFSLRFRVIDREGVSVMLSPVDVFEVKVTSATTNMSRKKGNSELPFPCLLGPTKVCPTPTHEVAFADITFVSDHIPAMGVKLWLSVTCTTKPEIKQLQLLPFVVKRSLGDREKRNR